MATKKLRLLKGGRKRDIFEDAKWKKKPVDINGDTQWVPSSFYDPDGDQWQEEKLRSKAEEIVKQITADPVEHSIASLMLENYTEKDIAEMLNISLARVEWFMRKIEGWKRKGGK